MRRRRQEGPYVVIGPAGEKRALSVSHGLSVAQDLATRHRKEEGVFTYEITDLLGTTVYATVTKEENGAILTRPKILAD
jgi:hypothetical protein